MPSYTREKKCQTWVLIKFWNLNIIKFKWIRNYEAHVSQNNDQPEHTHTKTCMKKSHIIFLFNMKHFLKHVQETTKYFKFVNTIKSIKGDDNINRNN